MVSACYSDPGILVRNAKVRNKRSLTDTLLAAGWIYAYAALVMGFKCLHRLEQFGKGRKVESRPGDANGVKER